jgi:hypothetical protein
MATHFLNNGALLSSHPVIPPSSSIGDKDVPNPNKTAKVTLPIGVENGSEYTSSAINGGQMISPRVNPSENAPRSKPCQLRLPKITVFFLFAVLHSHGFRDFQKTLAPITMVTAPKPMPE